MSALAPTVGQHVSVDVEQLVGCFVVEVGLRQAWPFIGFCDNRETPSKEIRLYIDAEWAIEGHSGLAASSDAGWMAAALELNGSTVREAIVGTEGNLQVTTVDGESLEVSGAPSSTTTGPPWWLSH